MNNETKCKAGCTGEPTEFAAEEASATTEREYLVFNATDGIPASPELMTWKEAEAFCREFPERFRAQGHCFTSRRNRIPPEEVVLLILDDNTLTLDLAMQRLQHRCNR